ncbi:MAG: hypothetical protein ACRDT4_23805 [Micromonosporaceae bacterium]
MQIGGLEGFAKELDADLAYYGEGRGGPAGAPPSLYQREVQGALSASVFGLSPRFPEAAAARARHDQTLASSRDLYANVVMGYHALATGVRAIAKRYGDQDAANAAVVDAVFPPPPPAPARPGPYTPGPGSVKVADAQNAYTPGPGSVKVADAANAQGPYTPGPGSVKVADAQNAHATTPGPGSVRVAENGDRVGAINAGHGSSPQLPRSEITPINPHDYKVWNAPRPAGL